MTERYPIMKEVIPSADPWCWLSKDDLYKVSRKILQNIGVGRIFTCDVEEVSLILREVYDYGRSRGSYERQGE